MDGNQAYRTADKWRQTETDRQTKASRRIDRQRLGRPTDWLTARQTDIQTDRQADSQTGRQTDARKTGKQNKAWGFLGQ